jgi:hypothetical protein
VIHQVTGNKNKSRVRSMRKGSAKKYRSIFMNFILNITQVDKLKRICITPCSLEHIPFTPHIQSAHAISITSVLLQLFEFNCMVKYRFVALCYFFSSGLHSKGVLIKFAY